MAATWLYERAWGKPKEYDPTTEEPNGVRYDLSKLSPQQLAEVKQAMLLLLRTVVGRAENPED
jgi:hypothetical protein